MTIFEHDGMQDIADGVDFVPLWFDDKFPPPIIRTYTKSEFQNVEYYPKSNRKYWIIKDGIKEYI